MLTGQTYLILDAVAPGRFAYRAVPATLSFEERDGRPWKLVLHQGKIVLEALRRRAERRVNASRPPILELGQATELDLAGSSAIFVLALEEDRIHETQPPQASDGVRGSSRSRVHGDESPRPSGSARTATLPFRTKTTTRPRLMRTVPPADRSPSKRPLPA